MCVLSSKNRSFYVSSPLSWELVFTGNFQSKLRYIIRVFLFIPRVWVSYHNVFTKGILKHETNKKLTKKKHNSNLVLSKKQGHLLLVNISRVRACHKLIVWSWRFNFYEGSPFTDTNPTYKCNQDRVFCSWFSAQSDFQMILYLTLTLWPWPLAILKKSININPLNKFDTRSGHPFVI